MKETGRIRWAAREREIRLTRPYQAALPDFFCTAENYDIIRKFCLDRFGEEPVLRRLRIEWDHGGVEETRMHCFLRREDADLFAGHFEALRFDQQQETRRHMRVWRVAAPWSHRIRYGPLDVPAHVRANP